MAYGKTVRGVGLVAAIVAIAAPAFGTVMPTTAELIEVTATSGQYSSTFSEVFPVASQGGFDGIESWTLGQPLVMTDGTTQLGIVENLSVAFDSNRQIDLSFAVTNSSATTPIMFNIRTTTILFDAVPNAQAIATASISATDGANDSDFDVSLSGMFPDSKAYQARYSDNAMVNSETVFGNLVSSFTQFLGGSVTEQVPFMTQFADLNTTVYSMEAEFKFGLSAGDQASGTSTFLIIPEPSALALLAFGSLLLRRRVVA